MDKSTTTTSDRGHDSVGPHQCARRPWKFGQPLPLYAQHDWRVTRISYLIISITPTRWPEGLMIVPCVTPTPSVVKSNPKSLNEVSDLISASLRPLTFTISPSLWNWLSSETAQRTYACPFGASFRS